jgi:hypothetical protein
MAFENVTYTFYTTTLGRSAIPTEEEFNKYKLENVQYMKLFLPFLKEREENGIDSAVCMMCEVDYTESQAIINSNLAKKSESLDGYSYSLDDGEKNRIQEGNFKTTEQKKRYWLDLFCEYYGGLK